MSPEERELLNRSVTLAEENNHMLHKIRSVQKWATYWSLLKVFLIIGIALGSFYFLEPFINKFIGIWNNVSGSQQQDLNSNPIQDFFKKF